VSVLGSRGTPAGCGGLLHVPCPGAVPVHLHDGLRFAEGQADPRTHQRAGAMTRTLRELLKDALPALVRLCVFRLKFNK